MNAQAEAAKETGMELAARNNPAVSTAREVARQLGRKFGQVNMDMVSREAERLGRPLTKLGNGAGSVFRNRSEWQFTGERIHSDKVQGHSNEIKVWQYVGVL